jgi:hypothetical protein
MTVSMTGFVQGVEETFMLARLTLKLLSLLGLGWRWNVQLWRLLLYAFLLLPGFIQVSTPTHTQTSTISLRLRKSPSLNYGITVVIWQS